MQFPLLIHRHRIPRRKPFLRGGPVNLAPSQQRVHIGTDDLRCIRSGCEPTKDGEMEVGSLVNPRR